MTADLIMEAARKGGFRLNLWPVDKGWQANFSRDGISWTVAINADPIAAIDAALSGTTPAVSGMPTDNAIGGIFS